MTITIKIFHQNEQGVFHANDTLTGYITTHGPFTLPNGLITITLAGYSHTSQAARNRTLTDKQRFFSITSTLYTGPIDIPAGKLQKWHFEMQIPSATEVGKSKIQYYPRKSGRSGEMKEELYALAPHKLPPSCSFEGQSIRPWTCAVIYLLKAHAGPVEKVKWYSPTAVPERVGDGSITIVPSPPSALEEKLAAGRGDMPGRLVDVRSKVFKHASSNLLRAPTEGREKVKRRSIGAWLTDKVGSGTPKAVFSITARTVTTLTAGQEIPIQLLLQYDSAKTNLQTLPDLRLVELKYKIKGLTDIVSQGFLSPDLYLQDKQTVFERTLKFGQLSLWADSSLDIGLPLQDGGVSYLKLDAQIAEEFKTYNIFRRYIVEVTLGFECAGKKKKAVFEWRPLKIVYKEGYVEDPALRLKMGNNTAEAVIGGAAVIVRALATALVLTTVLS